MGRPRVYSANLWVADEPLMLVHGLPLDLSSIFHGLRSWYPVRLPRTFHGELRLL